MAQKAIKVVVELHLRAVSCPGVHLTAKDDIYISLSFMSQFRKSGCLPPVFPLLFREKMTFEKIFKYAVDPGDVVAMLEDETVKVELVQLIPPVGETLACFEEDARRFLFPEPKLVPSFSGVDREVLMTRSFTFPGISPRFEFSTRTTISECSADAETNFHRNVPLRSVPKKRSTKRSCKQKCVSPKRTGSPLLERRMGRRGRERQRLSTPLAPEIRRSRSLPLYVAGRLSGHGNTQRLAQLTLDSLTCSWDDASSETPDPMRESWPEAGSSSSPGLTPQLPARLHNPSPGWPKSRQGQGGTGDQISSDTEDPLGDSPGHGNQPVFRGSSPSTLWRSYRELSSHNGSYSSSHGTWEEIQQRVRGLLTTPRAVHRLAFGATHSEVCEVLARRSISPGPSQRTLRTP
ncbi:spermatogenesis associated 6-like protein [Hypomesus transpacificus]|uniref:spermatogenesis associated 6-like protein n=1 Tax=Hypomesus transpacificus TaxID=137520 RepID=UPI001F07FD71|nr:spermatogenesis associated 6-like protein [Hypomesus transpacificus]